MPVIRQGYTMTNVVKLITNTRLHEVLIESRETDAIMTTREISHLTQVSHRLVLERAVEAFAAYNVDHNEFWHDYRTGMKTFKREMHLQKDAAMLAISGPWYADIARQAVISVFDVWVKNDELDRYLSIPF